MATFSINIGESTEATKYPMSSTSSIDYILDTLVDNVDNLLYPRYIRDAALSVLSSSAFKLTVASPSSISYIGVDSGDPSNRDINQKILLGKRDYNGNDIMSTSMLGDPNNDILLFNVKSDSVSNITTRVSILSGSGSSYIQSQYISPTTNLSLDVVSPGDINLDSVYGTVSLNRIVFPAISETSASASNNKTLKYYDNRLIWDEITFATSSVGTSSTPTSIYGSPVIANGYGLEFTDTRKIAVAFSDVPMRTSFENYPLSELLRRMVYNYLGPICSISIDYPYNSGFVEVGTNPSIKLTYTISKRSQPTFTTSLSNMIPSSYPPISTSTHTTVTGSASGVVVLPINITPTVFTVNVSDGLTQSSASASIQGIYPYFYGLGVTTSMTTLGLSNLNKLVDDQGDKDLFLSGQGYMFFIYPDSYGTMSSIIDNYGNPTFSSFTYSTQVLSSPTGLWSSRPYKVYRTLSDVDLGPISVEYQFIF